MSVKRYNKSDVEERIIPTVCASHCGGACILKVHVKGGVVTKIETDDSKEPQLRACLRGRAYRQRVYAPDRLKYPMKRIGVRGTRKFKRISWDEALNTIADRYSQIKETYGPAAVILMYSGGDLGLLHCGELTSRVLRLAGGCTRWWGSYSFGGAIFAQLVSFGVQCVSNSRDDILNSRFILMWGWDPAVSISGTNTTWYLVRAKESGAKIVVVDPRYTDSAAVLANQWIPIRPNTDTAMVLAMAYVMIKESLQNREFLDAYTVGFEKFKDYVIGLEDNVPKTPTWAEAITGVPATTIEDLAREYATIKPAAFFAGVAVGRSAYGEQFHRAAITLSAMTGNMGLHGGESGGRSWDSFFWNYPYKIDAPPYHSLRSGPNPVEEGKPIRNDTIPAPSTMRVHFSRIADAILKGRTGGYPSNYKMLYVVNMNFLNSVPNINKTIKALKKLEFIAVQEQFMTPTAKFADILLPVCSFFERNDITVGVGTPFYGYMNKIIGPLYESKPHLEIAKELAVRLGVTDFDYKAEDEWLREIAREAGIPDYENFKRQGIYRIDLSEPLIYFKKFVEAPTDNPLPTPSGKIEIYSQRLADMNRPDVPSIPKYIEAWESRNDPLTNKYPLQLITVHCKRRALTQFENIPWLREVEQQVIWINPLDAKKREISDGDRVKVFNDRGKMEIKAKVTERIMPGVVSIPNGAWYNPDEKGVDKGGSTNILLLDKVSPVGTTTTNTCLVQVRRD